uniref:Cytokine receptor-like factor 2-like D1 domain-containing protein n=1 Tax=Anabas testudineus TaxID=64144 RepID=A0A7N6FD29_ANATE
MSYTSIHRCRGRSAPTLMRLLLPLFLMGHVFAKEPPEVDCLVVHLKYVSCSWNKQGTPGVNYTFYSRFHDKEFLYCTNYVSENNVNVGCNVPYDKLIEKRFEPYYTKLVDGSRTDQASGVPQKHNLKDKVLLAPPVNLTVKNESDSNLWFYWNQTYSNCVDSEVRFRTNNNNWETSKVSTGRHSFCINLPSSNSRYEMQVRSKMGSNCGGSPNWSDWSEPVVWGSHNSTDNTQKNLISVWTPVLYVVGVITLIILVMMLLHYERLRIILIPVVPKPSLNHRDMENWFQSSKGLNFEDFKANYNERACPVREYCQVSQSDSESSGGSTCSVTTNQTDCSVSIPVNESEDVSTPCSTSTSSITDSSEKELHISV